MPYSLKQMQDLAQRVKEAHAKKRRGESPEEAAAPVTGYAGKDAGLRPSEDTMAKEERAEAEHGRAGEEADAGSTGGPYSWDPDDGKTGARYSWVQQGEPVTSALCWNWNKADAPA